MKTVLINGLNSKVGGGLSVLSNLVACLQDRPRECEFLVIAPSRVSLKPSSPNVRRVDVPWYWEHTAFLPLVYSRLLGSLAEKLYCDAILNLADIVIATEIAQVYLFDWAHAIAPRSDIWGRMPLAEWVHQQAKLFFFKRYLGHATCVVTQTETNRKALQESYLLSDVRVVPNAVSLENFSSGEYKDFGLSNIRTNLLCLSHYYPHKNLEVLLAVARLIRRANLPWSIVLTLSAEQGPGAKTLLRAVNREGLTEVLVNVGPVEMKHVPALYEQCDALILPTLLESFSGTYVEAMFHRKPIFTSDRPFARDVCQDAATYFDPLDPHDIVAKIDSVASNRKRMEELTARGSEILKSLPGWSAVTDELLKSLGSAFGKKTNFQLR